MVEVQKTAIRRRGKPPAGLKPIEDDARLNSGDAFDADLTHDEANSPVLPLSSKGYTLFQDLSDCF